MVRAGPIIDAHHHFWLLDRGDYGWLVPDLGVLYRDYGPEDLQPLIGQAGIEATVLVQAAPTDAETDFLLQVAADWPVVAGVVGWTDLEAPRAEARIETLASVPIFKGLRPMLQDEPDPDWLSRPAVATSVAKMAALGLSLDALVRPAQIPILTRFADAHPTLPIVLDHGGKPNIADGGFDTWARAITDLARRPHVYCKLSGLLTEAGLKTSDDNLAPYVDHLLACFSPNRLMWGSDWPVLRLAGEYGDWLAQAVRLLGRLSHDEASAILGATATRFYHLEPME